MSAEVKNIYIDPAAAAAELCKRKLSFFVKEFWDVIVPNELIWNWHLDALCDEIQTADERVFAGLEKLHDVIINVPPGTSKTKIVSVLSTAWEFARKPSIKVFVGSYSDQAVSAISDDIRLVMRSERFRRYFPYVEVRKDRDTIHNFKTTANGEFYAFTVGGSLTSKHADILKVDDPLNPKQAASQAELLTVNTFFDKTLPSRKVDKKVTPTYLVMQRLAANDPTGHLLNKKGKAIHHVCLPGTLSNAVKPEKYKKFYLQVTLASDHPLVKTLGRHVALLDPVRLGAKELADLRLDLGADGYAGQVDQLPVQEGGLIWRKWFIEVDDAVFPPLSAMTSVGTDWDLAYTKDDDNAASAYIRSGRINEKMFIDDLGAVYFEFPELISFMRMQRAPHYIEAKAPGKSAKPVLVKMRIPAIEVEVQGGKDKPARARMASPYAEAGMVYIRKSLADFLYNDTRQGILNFPKGSHADLADVLAQAIQRIFRGKLITASAGKESVLDGIS